MEKLIPKGQSGLHADNPYIDAAIELSPLGDARDVYEGVTNGDYSQAIQGAIGIGGTIFGVGLLTKGYKAYKAALKLRKLNKSALAYRSLIGGMPPTVAPRIMNEGREAFKTSQGLIKPLMSTATSTAIDGYNDAKSIAKRFK